MCCYTSFKVFSSQGFKKNNLKINFIYQNLQNMRSVDGEVWWVKDRLKMSLQK